MIELLPLPLPASADPSKFEEFGRQVKGVNPGSFTTEEFAQIHDALYKHDVLVFRDVTLTPAQQYALAKAFDPNAFAHAHGGKIESNKRSVLNTYLITVPDVPQVQVIGNGTIYNHEGIEEATLKGWNHRTFHKSHISTEDEAKGDVRFYRWHMDAALYELGPPKVTTLYGVSIPRGPRQNCRYDDGTGDTLEVPLAATAYVSGRTMFEILPKELKSLAVRSSVKYAPHPFVWMASAGAIPTALGLESDGREVPLDQLPPWDESLRKTYPMLWKNPVTGGLHLMAHGCGAMEIFVQPLPEGVDKSGALYPDGTTITDLKEVRRILYTMQRPAIAPSLVYPHEWRPNDLVLWHNRGVMHTAVGILSEDQHRVCHQCTLASTDDPIGPSSEDVEKWV